MRIGLSRLGAVLVIITVAGLLGGCAGPGPRLMPVSPARIVAGPDGSQERWYDADADGRPEHGERLGAEGLITHLLYDPDEDGRANETIDMAAVPNGERRDLLVILDSVPYVMVRDAWEAGRFRFFPPPARVIAPFPVMTDPSLVDFFGLSPGVAIESEYYDGKQMTAPYAVYLNAGLAAWHAKTDFWLPHGDHAHVYLNPKPWFNHELRRIQDLHLHSDRARTVGYVVGASALGAIHGRDGHQYGLVEMDRYCRQIMFESRGRTRLTLMSDHGHNLVNSRRIPLGDRLAEFGYRVGDRLDRPGDVGVPEFAMVTCAAVYTRDPSPVARDVLGIEGIELSAYIDGDALVVLTRDGEARVTRQGDAYRYIQVRGDPLELQPSLEAMAKSRGTERPSAGLLSDADLFRFTSEAELPDAIDRLWRAFHEQFQHKPDVLISVADGYHCGSRMQSELVGLEAAHGNLHSLSSSGFCLTTAGRLPPAVRMRNLRAELKRLGADL